LLLPGLLIVRASWTVVPFLSLSFWIVSWAWLPPGGREAFLRAALLTFLILLSLRLLKPLGIQRPSTPVLSVVAAALARLIPFFFWPVAPGPDMSFHGLTTLLMTWKDGLPTTYEPLLAIRSFGGYPPGLHELAADVALLSGMAPHRAVFLASLAAQGLLHVAAFALLKRWLGVPAAALAAVVAVALARLPTALLGLGEGASTLALALSLAAASPLLGGSDRSTAVGAGFFMGAGLVSHGPVAAIAALALGAALRPWRPDPPRQRVRLGLAGLAALLGAGPLLLRRPSTGLELVPLLGAVGVYDMAVATLALALAAALAWLIHRLWTVKSLIARVALALLALGGGEGARRDALARPVLVGPDDLAAAAWIRDNTRPLDRICNRGRQAGVWLPALAGRAVSDPWLPPIYRNWPKAPLEGPCAYTYGTVPLAPSARPAFRSGPVVVLEGDLTPP
jgi:hypothetical protein